ncbi:MAG: DJ-1/PfpI family protein [Candidatus Thorarchaeota archaeon]
MKIKSFQKGIIFLLIFLGFYVSSVPFISPSNSVLPTDGLKILYLLADDFTNSYYYMYPGILEKYGFNVCLASLNEKVYDHYNNEYTVDYTFSEVVITDFVAIMILGGSTDYPSNLGDIPEAMNIIRDANESGLVLVAHDEGPIALADAGVISGKNVTCTAEIQAEIIAVGANLLDEVIVIDGKIVTTKSYTGGIQIPVGIIKALGLYDNEPPILEDSSIDILDDIDLGSISVTATFSDIFGIDTIMLQLFRYNGSIEEFEFYIEQQMTGDENKVTFSSTMVNIPNGNYSLSIIATDLLGNSITYGNHFRYLINPSKTNALNPNSIIFINLIIVHFLFLKSKKSSK